MTATKPISVCFFRNLLRVHDNQSLYHAVSACKTNTNHRLLPVVCLDPRMIDISPLNKALGAENKTPKTWNFKMERCAQFRTRFLIECILSLKKELTKRKSDLLILYGKPEELFPKLNQFLQENNSKIDSIHTHKEYAYEELNAETSLSKAMHNITYHHDATLVHPDDVDFTFDKTSKVYTHFRRRIEKMDQPIRPLLEIPDKLPSFPEIVWKFNHSDQGEAHLMTLYKYASIKEDSRSAYPWKGGEQEAIDRLNCYLFKTKNVAGYKRTRNGLIGTEYSTKFSAFLASGCLSPRLIWHELDKFDSEKKESGQKEFEARGDDDGVYWVRFELLWRDYFRFLTAGNGNKLFLLHGFRNMEPREDDGKDTKKPKNSYYDKTWKTNDGQFEKWKNGQTGVPFIDACMRELILTGFMNNRGRQNVASYLAKDLELDWRIGAEWFESILKDHDVYSNYGNWQYVSGVGCDPREGMRHFNIMKQSKDYDLEGEYIKLWCPELEHVPAHFVHCPWLMNKEDQSKYRCIIGRDYPEPMAAMESWKRHYPSDATSKNKITSYFTPSDNKTIKKQKVVGKVEKKWL